MGNNLIENKTNVFYTVELSEGVGVRESHFSGGEVYKVDITREDSHFHEYPNLNQPLRVAEYVGGKVIKHTRTTVVTEVTEEVKGDK